MHLHHLGGEVLANAMGVFQFELHLAAVLFNEVIQQQGGQVFEIFVGCVKVFILDF